MNFFNSKRYIFPWNKLFCEVHATFYLKIGSSLNCDTCITIGDNTNATKRTFCRGAKVFAKSFKLLQHDKSGLLLLLGLLTG